MRRYRALLVLVALATALALATVAAASSVPMWTPKKAASLPKVPASALVVKTAMMLPSAGYPWVQPLFLGKHPTLRLHISTQLAQPPASIGIAA
jgi:hypothetical protein